MGIERLRMLLGVVLLSTSASLWAEGWPTTDFEVLVVNERNQRVNWGVGGPLEQVLASWGIELAELETEFPEATRLRSSACSTIRQNCSKPGAFHRQV